MKKISKDKLVFLFLIGALLVHSCDITKMDYIPTHTEIKSKLDEFIIEGSSIEGLYGNYDVDSIIFKSTFKNKPKQFDKEILELILVKAQKNGWNLIISSPHLLELNRTKPVGKFYSLEHVRIIMKKEPLTIYLAWIQADSVKKLTDIKETSELSFAEKVLWPKLEFFLAQPE